MDTFEPSVWFVCKHCSRAFPKKKLLIRHKKQFHQTECFDVSIQEPQKVSSAQQVSQSCPVNFRSPSSSDDPNLYSEISSQSHDHGQRLRLRPDMRSNGAAIDSDVEEIQPIQVEDSDDSISSRPQSNADVIQLESSDDEAPPFQIQFRSQKSRLLENERGQNLQIVKKPEISLPSSPDSILQIESPKPHHSRNPPPYPSHMSSAGQIAIELLPRNRPGQQGSPIQNPDVDMDIDIDDMSIVMTPDDSEEELVILFESINQVPQPNAPHSQQLVPSTTTQSEENINANQILEEPSNYFLRRRTQISNSHNLPPKSSSSTFISRGPVSCDLSKFSPFKTQQNGQKEKSTPKSVANSNQFSIYPDRPPDLGKGHRIHQEPFADLHPRPLSPGHSNDLPVLEGPYLNESTNKNCYSCRFCNKSFNERGDLKHHERIHIDQAPCKCPHCPLSFRVPADLQVHQKIHLEESLKQNDTRSPAGKFGGRKIGKKGFTISTPTRNYRLFTNLGSPLTDEGTKN